MNANGKRKICHNRVPVDSGWAWVCCFGSFISMYYAIGAFKSMGVLFGALIRHYDSSSSVTALVMGFSSAGLAIFSPIAGFLSDRYGHRKVVMSGAIISALGPLLTAFSNNIYFAVFFFGLFNGIGNAFMLTPSLIIVTKYFKKWRTLANGLAMAGGSLGQLTIPWLLEYWLERYHLKGTLILYSSHFLHAMIGGALLRPISFYETVDTLEDEECMEEKRPLSRPLNDQDQDLEIQCNDMQCNTDNKLLSKKPIEKAQETRKLPILPFTLFKNPLYTSYIIAICFGNCGYMDSILYLPSLSKENDRINNLSNAAIALNSSTLMSIMGISDLIGRVFGGIIADLKFIRRSLFSAFCLMLISCSAFIVALSLDISAEFYILSITLGLFGGLYSAVFPIVLMDYVGMILFPQALSFSFFFMGLTNTFIPPLLGLLQDINGSYRAVYMVTSMMIMASTLLYASERFIRKYFQKKTVI